MIVKQTTLTVTENTRLADGIYRLRLAGDTSAITAPGQFVNLKLSGFFLRRPISVCDWENGELTLIYKVLGHGTEAMTGMAPGTELDVLTGLGNGYDVSRSGEHPLLVGGGVGIPPLYGLAKRLVAQGKRITAVLGFNRESEIFLAEEFRALGVEVISRPVASVENDLVRHNPGHLARELMALHAERNMRLVEPSTPGHTRNKVER